MKSYTMNSLAIRRASRLAILGLMLSASALFTGCAAVKMPAASGTAANAASLKEAGLQAMNPGEFKSAPGKAAEADRGISVRGTNTISPNGGSFAAQLKDQFSADLKASGLLDDKAPVIVSATITDNMLDAGMGTGKGRLAARFQATRDGKQVFDKELVAEATWESSFMAAVAIPAAFNQYGALYQALVAKLIADPDFKSALKR
jgi:hypothetical protein